MYEQTLLTRARDLCIEGGFSSEVVDPFCAFIRQASDRALFRMNPYRYAQKQGLNPRVAIDLFLFATHVRILDFSWGVLCPGCASFMTTSAALRSLSNSRCYLCKVDVAPSVGHNVEVAFTVSPSVRPIRFHSPQLTSFSSDLLHLTFSSSVDAPEDMRQKTLDLMEWEAILDVEEPLQVSLNLPAGNFSVVVPLLHSACELQVREEAQQTEVSLDLVKGRFLPDRVTLAPGPIRLTLHNRLRDPVLVGVVKDWLQPGDTCAGRAEQMVRHRYLTGKELVTSQTFRDLFRAESIPSEGGLEFRNLTLLFSDLKQSTDLYRRVGDLRAFGMVRDHFSALNKTVASHGGAVVKTIGDAIMASFPEPAAALEAALSMHRAMEPLEGDLLLKIGLHAGPCIGVELNDRLDYFGQTVNIAARVQGVAAARETVITEQVWGAAEVQQVVTQANLRVERGECDLRGVGRTPVVRLQ